MGWFVKWIFILLGIVALVAVVAAGCATSRRGYESAAYKVVGPAGAMEVRDYPELVVAQTPLAGPNGGPNGGFMNLFRYISGANAGQKKLPMTTPVFIASEAEGAAATNSSMSFVMPSQYALADLPRPADAQVSLRRVAAARYAARRFSGRRIEKLLDRETAALRQWMVSQGYQPVGAPLYAFYDPPWTPGFLRRNEVLFRFQKDAPPPAK